MHFREHDVIEDRPLWRSIGRGLRLRCPACGQGRVLRGYLKLRDSCPSCGEALHHQRTDDGPAYMTIQVVGHALAPVMLGVFLIWRPSPWTMIGVLLPASLLLAVVLLPMMKGALLAIQWANRMHGFDETARHPDPADPDPDPAQDGGAEGAGAARTDSGRMDP